MGAISDFLRRLFGSQPQDDWKTVNKFTAEWTNEGLPLGTAVYHLQRRGTKHRVLPLGYMPRKHSAYSEVWAMAKQRDRELQVMLRAGTTMERIEELEDIAIAEQRKRKHYS